MASATIARNKITTRPHLSFRIPKLCQSSPQKRTSGSPNLPNPKPKESLLKNTNTPDSTATPVKRKIKMKRPAFAGAAIGETPFKRQTTKLRIDSL
jgi:hypothetical protein